MAINVTFYGTLEEANTYFETRLHERSWSVANNAERQKGLIAATRIIDTLNFKGNKHPVYELLLADPDATDEEIRAAELTQPLEFPRGADTAVPETIRLACYEMAHHLLDGKDPEKELELMGIRSLKFDTVQTVYAREDIPIEHLVNGVPSALAWRYLRPFLRDQDAVRLSRVS
jgi:hypothetical protein